MNKSAIRVTRFTVDNVTDAAIIEGIVASVIKNCPNDISIAVDFNTDYAVAFRSDYYGRLAILKDVMCGFSIMSTEDLADCIQFNAKMKGGVPNGDD